MCKRKKNNIKHAEWAILQTENYPVHFFTKPIYFSHCTRVKKKSKDLILPAIKTKCISAVFSHFYLKWSSVKPTKLKSFESI